MVLTVRNEEHSGFSMFTVQFLRAMLMVADRIMPRLASFEDLSAEDNPNGTAWN